MKTTLLLIVSFIFLVMTACNSEKKESKIQTKDALENIMGRKSVRKYLPKPVEKEKIEVLLKAGMAAPSGKDVRPWELIVIDDREVLDSMAAVLPYAKMLKEAPMAIVVCGDTTKSSYWYLDCSAVTQNILLAAEAIGLGAVWTATYPYADRMEVVKKYFFFFRHLSAIRLQSIPLQRRLCPSKLANKHRIPEGEEPVSFFYRFLIRRHNMILSC